MVEGQFDFGDVADTFAVLLVSLTMLTPNLK